MTNLKRAFWASTALAGGVLMATAASAQSTGTTATEGTTVDSVIITGARGPRTVDGAIVAETVTKSRSTITQEYIETQAAGQTILQTINLVPGVNFTNNDPYGSAGGNLRIRGFDGNRISLTFDGIPLNDTGNYAIYSNQQLDPELIERAAVNLGTTDVDSPTASATGGTVNYTTRRPSVDGGVTLVGSIGDFSYRRFFGMVDTGEIGPWGTTAFGSLSLTNYDKWKGPGEIDKEQWNGRLFQDLGQGNFLSLAFNWNENRNNFYRNLTMAQWMATPGLENDIACGRLTPVAGTAQNENTGNTIVRWDGSTGTGNCTNYHGLRINPSNTGSIRGQFSYGLTDSLRLTIDPSFQYTLANGGGFTALAETDGRLRGATAAGGYDLNGDGDILDTVTIYTPSNTNTRRYGVTASLIWDLNDDHRFRFAYTADYGRHRQTGEATYTDFAGNPLSVFGGKDGWGPRVRTADGSYYRTRDRFSIAQLNQLAAEWRGQFLEDDLTINLGLRAPVFTRDLNQLCYSQNNSSSVYCTTQTPSATLPNGNVQFATTGATQYIAPFSASFEFEDVLPNAGVSYRVMGSNHIVYASYAEGLSAPRTDNLYTVGRAATGGINFSQAEPETTQSIDIGYRYQGTNLIGQLAWWWTQYDNRIVSAFDEDLGFFVDRNVGSVEMQGFDAQVGWRVLDTLSVYASASWIDSELQNNIPLSATGFIPTQGKELVETPEWQYAARVDWDVTSWMSVGLQGKYVGERWATDVNDEQVPSYTVWDLDARWDLDFVNPNTFLQLNVINLFDEEYLGGISSRENAITILDTDPVTPGNQTRAGSSPTYALGAPRTWMLTLRTRF